MREGDPIWMSLAPLDVDPSQAIGIYALLSDNIRTTCERTAASLRPAFPAAADRITTVLTQAPQVLSYGAAYQWVTRLHQAVSADDASLFDNLLADFARFECAAAMLSGQDFTGTLPSAARSESARSATLVVPLVGAFEVDALTYHVRSGCLEAKPLGPDGIGGLRVDSFEGNYRLARSKSQFNLDEPGRWEKAHDELTHAYTLGEQLVPGLYSRYVTDVVPLQRADRISNAGTDEAAPFVVYTSFDRDPIDLIACLAHEEAHALINGADKILGEVLPDTDDTMPVPWKPGMMRSLSNVMHGLISFGRAAQVRTRAVAAGLNNPDNDEARRREIRWVTDVTQQLCDGVLGPLPRWLRDWMEQNLGVWDIPVRPPTPLEVIARAPGSASMFPWTLVTGGQTRAAATELCARLSFGPWDRSSGAFPDQDRTDLDVDDHPAAATLAGEVLPRLIADEFGEAVSLMSLKAHRIRRGDKIRAHSDDGSPDVAYRAVLGASAVPTDGGLLRLCDTTQQPVISVPLRYGDCLVFSTDGLCNHDVTELKSSSFRYTVIASYRRAANA